MRYRYRCSVVLLLIIAASTAEGQKRLQVKLPHPPILGEGLVGARVIFGQVTGRCSREFSDLLRQDLRAHGIPVVTQAEPGVTAVVTISVDISECQALPSQPIIGSGLPAMHISRTNGHFLAALHVNDWWSGDALVTQTIRADSANENQSPTNQPEWPAPADLIALARLQALVQTRRLYEPWIDTEEVLFMDDRDCNLREELDLFKAADYKSLLQAARTNAETCHANPKTVAAAWYDFGIACMVMQNYDGALAAFDRTGKLRDSRMVAEAMTHCQTNKSLAEALARHVLAWVRQTHKDVKPAESVRTGILLTNDLVIRLVQGNVAEEDILKMIASEIDRFALGDDDRLKLKQAGVPDAIIIAMQQRK